MYANEACETPAAITATSDPGRPTPRWLAVALSVAAAVLLGCTSPGETLRVMTYNIHHGRGIDGEINLARIAAVINAANVDLVALHEVDRGVERSGRVDQPAELAQLTGLTPVFEQNIPYQGGAYGNAILSRLPIVAHENHFLPQMRPGEQRGALEVQVEVAGRMVSFLATHFDYRGNDDSERMASVELVTALAADRDHPVILAGDLNALPDSRVLETLRASWREASAPPPGISGFTYPADEPVRRIDYVVDNRHASLEPVKTSVVDERSASDHRPVVVEYRIAR